MRGWKALPVLLVLLWASTGQTQTTKNTSTNTASSVSPYYNATFYNCTKREGTGLTVLMDKYFAYATSTEYYVEKVLKRLSARFPCVTRQYTSFLLDYNELNPTNTSDTDTFLQSLQQNYWDSSSYYNLVNCNQSLLYGLKRALEISPAESVIVVVTSGSMVDYNNTQLLSDVYTLLEKKKSQIHILWISGYCSVPSALADIFNHMALSSFGEFVQMGNLNYFKLMNSMELLLSKPLNNSVQILDLYTNMTVKYTTSFNVTNSIRYLLIAGFKNVTLDFIDPNGNQFVFEKLSTNYYYYYSEDQVNYYLVKSPAMGTWTLNAKGSGILSVRILGFTGLNVSGNCSDSDCHPNATCGEFGGAGQCTCKEGFAGDGYHCEDIDECQDYYANNCNYYSGGSCVNTIGSYSCDCYYGNVYKKEYGCVDVDRCANSSLNDCHPLAECTYYYYGYYTCTCPYGYYGDGRYCEVNECQQGSPCGSNECIKYNGSYACFDPCYNYTVLSDSWRSTTNVYDYYYYYYYYYGWFHSDYYLNGWYRLKADYGKQMPEYCVPTYSCGTYYPMWLNGSHPNIADGIVNRTTCTNVYGDCCTVSNTISVKNCSGGFYVYKLQGTPNYYSAYCIESKYNCSGLDCASDEECKVVDEAPGCSCRNTSYLYDWITPGNLAYLEYYIRPTVTCGLDNIEVTFSKCVLENLGYNTSSMHLRDDSCQGIRSKQDKAYITLVTQPKNGSCGGEISSTQKTITYMNTVYLTPRTDGGQIRRGYNINFNCSYPLSMDINLISSINSLSATTTINVVGTPNFTITMGLFQDSGYTNQYSGYELWLDSSSILYVGAIATGSSGSSQFVLLIKNCYATPTINSSYGMSYDIIKDRCPNKNDPTISVAENGASLKGRFSFQVFKFLSGFEQVYLHCEVGLCDTSSSDCSAGCSLTRSQDVAGNSETLHLGPIKYKAASPSGGAASPSGGGITVSISKLFISAIVFLLILYHHDSTSSM